MWDEGHVRKEILEDREKELIGEFWRPLISEGALARRFENTRESALEIVDELINMESTKDYLLLQEELVKGQKRLIETEACKVLYSRLQKLLAEQKNTLMVLADEAKRQNDLARAKSIQEECEHINTLLEKTFGEMKELEIPISRRFYLWLFPRKFGGKVVKLEDDDTEPSILSESFDWQSSGGNSR